MRSIADRLTIATLLKGDFSGKDVNICGIVHESQELHGQQEVLINDGSSFTSITARFKDSNFQISQGSNVRLAGQWQTIANGELLAPQDCKYQLHVTEWETLGVSDPLSYPLKSASPEFLRANPHFRIRLPFHALLARFRSAVISSLTDFFDTHPGGPFYQVHLPVITWSDAEGTNEVFAVPSQLGKGSGTEMVDTFFGRGRKFLQVSATFHGEPCVMGLDRIWTLTPCFRPERAEKDTRHLAEFYMLEVAMNYVDSLETLLNLMEEMIHGLVTRLRRNPAVIAFFDALEHGKSSEQAACTTLSAAELRQRWDGLLTSKWPRVTHAEAIAICAEAESQGKVTFTRKPRQGRELTTEHEYFVVQHFNSPVFITQFPILTRLFSALHSPGNDPTVDWKTAPYTNVPTTEAFDLLLPGVAEICSGGLREHRLDVLQEVMAKKGIPQDSWQWFLDIRRWGTAPHGGFGIGFERLLMYLTGVDSAMDMIPFPRYPGVCGC